MSTELAIKNRKNKEDRETRDIVPRKYQHLLDVFEKGEITTLSPHRRGINLGIDLEEGKTVPIKKIYALSYDQIEELSPIPQTEGTTSMDPLGQDRTRIIYYYCQKEGRQTQALC